ncbi:hypothetical protein [Yoonia algicola]|uniref:Uncharacterized protein n=1 Tax=Yoonia algicola TaxID=3137368 RepID=A0AAN0M8W2_9RHOB
MTGMIVSEKLPRKPAERQKDELSDLREKHCLNSTIVVPDAAAPIEITADLMRRSIDVGMTLRSPDDKKSTKARVNWLLRQVKTTQVEELFVRLLWPGASESTQYPVSELRKNLDIASHGKNWTCRV